MDVEVRFEAKDDAVVAGDEMNDEEEEGTDEIAVFVNMYGQAVFVIQQLRMFFPVDLMEVLEELQSVKAMRPDFVELQMRKSLRWMRSLYLMLSKEPDMRVEGLQLVTLKAKQLELK